MFCCRLGNAIATIEDVIEVQNNGDKIFCNKKLATLDEVCNSNNRQQQRKACRMKRFTVQLEDNEFEKLEIAATQDMSKNAAFARKCIVRHLEDGGSTQELTEDEMGEALLGIQWAKVKELMEAEGGSAAYIVGRALAMQETYLEPESSEPGDAPE